MPTEFRFDDLDLREQPARGDSTAMTDYSGSGPTCQSLYCGKPTEVTCCTDQCK